MEQQIMLLAFFLIGIVGGVIATWLILRNGIEVAQTQAKNESQIENARLNERLLAIQEETTRNHQAINEREQKINTLRNQLSDIQNQRAQLEERASRVAPLEHQLEGIANFREQITKLSTQLAERTQEQQTTEQRLQSVMASEKLVREKIEQLQTKLQDETNRNATLAEQVIYLPELQQKLNQLETEQSRLNQILADYREKIGTSETIISHQTAQIKRLEQEKDTLASSKVEFIQNQQALTAKVAELTTQLESERAQSGEKIALLNEARSELSNQFKALANDILEEKTKRFTEQNQSNMEQVLTPLKIKLQEFQGKVEEVYVQEGKDRSALAEQVKLLMNLNNQLSQDAHNLTTALKGQSKAQGNWGEFILDRVLENSGLTKGEHYVTQVSHNREDGTRAQPDVIINLPEGRHLVIDAKVSIVAYNDYVNADNDIIRESALKRHIESVRNHINGLSSKHYQNLYQLKSLDFVIMFVPVEPAFMLAIAQDSNLWQEAWTKNVLLVSPSTLLFVVRVVAHLWRQEQQTRNAQDIARRGAELYNKLVGFVEDFEKIGVQLTQAQDTYAAAISKFKNGKGNVIRQAEMLKELGIKPTKSLSAKLVDDSKSEN